MRRLIHSAPCTDRCKRRPADLAAGAAGSCESDKNSGALVRFGRQRGLVGLIGEGELVSLDRDQDMTAVRELTEQQFSRERLFDLLLFHPRDRPRSHLWVKTVLLEPAACRGVDLLL